MKTQNKETKLLWKEIESEHPGEERIRALVEQGANIRGDFLYEAILDIVPSPPGGHSLELKFVELLIKLGAEPDYREDGGYNCLWPASVCIRNSALVDLLLRYHADPNCYSKEDQSTILSAVMFDEREGDATKEEQAELLKCIKILKQYKAKTTREFLIDRKKEETNNPLWKELQSEHPGEERIRQLVKEGADPGGDFLKDAIFVMMPAHDDDGKSGHAMPDLNIFKLLAELGADVNFEDDTFNCLFEASLCRSPDLVKMLLELGANPNSVSTELPEQTILDYLSADCFYEEKYNSAGGEVYLAKIIAMLKDYGAKSHHEPERDEPEPPGIDERALLQLVVRFYSEGNVELIESILDPGITYGSEWVSESLKGSEKFLDYFKQKFETQKKHGVKLNVHAHPLKFGRTHFLIIKQSSSPDDIVAEVRFKTGRLADIRLFPRLKNPLTFENTSRRFETAMAAEKKEV